MRKVCFLGDTLNSDEPLGVQRYGYEILKELDNLDLPFKCELVIPKDQKCRISFKNINIVAYGTYKFGGFFWRQLWFPLYLKKNGALGVDLTLGLSILKDDVCCLHDCIFEKFPEDFVGFKGNIKRLNYLFRAKIISKKAKKILTVSDFSKKELSNYYNIEDNKISVIYNAWQHISKVESNDLILDKLHLQKKEFYFSLGSMLPHKNFKWIYCAAKQNPSDIFIVTGTNRLNKEEYQILGNLIFTGYLSDSEIKSLYSNCKAFILPSFSEGFGIPPLEALACGAEIIISDMSCLPEIYENSAIYINPKQYDCIDINKILSSKIIEVDNVKKILNKYSWKQSAEKLKNILVELQ